MKPQRMKKIPALLLFLFFVSWCFATPTFQQDTTPLQKGQFLNALLAAGKSDSLYQIMTPAFQKALNGQQGFKLLMQQLPAQLGKELSVEKEDVFQEAGFFNYYRISRFEKSPSVTTRFIWKDKALHGFSIRPTVTPAASAHLDYKTKTPLQLPFSGTWYVAWGGREPHLNYHVVAPDQRFAYDFIYAEDGKLSKDDPTENRDYFGFGKPIFSPAAGRVVLAVDTVEDNRLGMMNSQSPPGNYVVIDHGNSEYSFFAHFKKGTVAVKEGNTVKAGDLLGQMGNSGQSSLPHLHYHLQNGKGFQQGVGLPAFFRNYTADGKKVAIGEPIRGQIISSGN